MTVSSLRCELNTEDVPKNRVITNFGATRYLWRVWVDSRLIADSVLPFSPTDDWIELKADVEHSISGDGYRWVHVRRIDDYVIWFNPAPGDPLGGYSPGLDDGEVFGFQYDPYRTAISECIKKDDAALYSDDHGDSLPELQPAELHALLARSFPDADEALYTMPKLSDDPRGIKLIEAVKEGLFTRPPDHVEISDEPDDLVEFRIGLDKDGFPESWWLIGRNDSGLVVKFVSYPQFPLWMSGKHIDQVFELLYREIISHSR